MSNGRLTHLLAYESYQAPMMLHSLRIARNTAMMCGHPGAVDQLKAMIEDVEKTVPIISRRFDEERFAEMGAALQEATEFSVRWQKVHWRRDWEREGHLAVVIGDRVFLTKDIDIRDDSPLKGELLAYLSEIAPITCSYVEPVEAET